MELTKTENNALPRKAQSTGLIAILSDPEKAQQFEKGLTIAKIIDTAIPISQFENTREIKQSIDIQLTKLVAMLNLKWSLTDFQIKQIVEDLVEKFPHETVEDFILVFKKARQGEFGELTRLDSVVIFKWVEKYLEQKYDALVDKLNRERDEYYKTQLPPPPAEHQDRWAEVLAAVQEGFAGSVPEVDANEEGQETPKRRDHPWDFNEADARKNLTNHFETLMACQERTVRERRPEWNEQQIQAHLANLSHKLVQEPKPKWKLKNKHEKRQAF